MSVNDLTSGGTWLPVAYAFRPEAASTFWMDFGTEKLEQPFFSQTVKRLKSRRPPAAEAVTDFEMLLKRFDGEGFTSPAGIIFHVSRCGSTLLANSLRTCSGAVVLSEAAPVSALCHPNAFRRSPFRRPEWLAIRQLALGGLIRQYSLAFGETPKPVVLKCHTASLLVMALIRSVWPTTPCLIVVRDPLEVLVSNHLRPAGWVRARHVPMKAVSIFGWPAEEVHGMTEAEYIARGLGRFFEIAASQQNATCRLIDYRDVNIQTMQAIAEYFGLPSGTPASWSKVTLSTRRTWRDAGDSRQIRSGNNRPPRLRCDKPLTSTPRPPTRV